ncbi:MAG: recombination protein RecR [Bacilli bacterium]|nr:recombination protein RecR [Bacilli bacterium]
MYPKILEDTINYFKKLPGIGDKSAERMALALLNYDSQELADFGNSVINLKDSLHPCPTCGYLTDLENECAICLDKSRDENLICVVEDYKSAFLFEKMGSFKGKYHVLNKLISPMNGVNPEDINLHTLIERVKKLNNPEIILALRSTVEGDATTLYINKVLDKEKVTVSRLSYGIPMGAEIDYLDVMTLNRAIEDRKQIS